MVSFCGTADVPVVAALCNIVLILLAYVMERVTLYYKASWAVAGVLMLPG